MFSLQSRYNLYDDRPCRTDSGMGDIFLIYTIIWTENMLKYYYERGECFANTFVGNGLGSEFQAYIATDL